MRAPTKLLPPGRAPHGIGLRRVIVGTDLSLDGDRALRRTAALSLAHRAILVVTYVLSRRVTPAVESVVRGAAEIELQKAVGKLEQLLEQRGRSDVAVRGRLLRGRPADEIRRLADTVEPDLIVVGRRGQSRLREMVLGSTARRLLREGRHPVLVVSRPPTAPYRKVVVGLDLAPAALRAAKMAGAVIPTTATAIAVHAYEGPFGGLPPAFVPDWGNREPGALRTRTRLLRRALEPIAAGAKPWQLTIRQGDPRRVLLEMARRKRADLVVVGSRGKSRLERTVLGSVAEGVLDRAPCDVLLVR